jgi:hypothetical protein
MEHFRSMSGTSGNAEIPEGWVIITTMPSQRRRSVEATVPVRTLLTGNPPHDTRIAQLDSTELKNASAQDIVNAVAGSDNWTSILACCKLHIGTNKLATETSERLMHPDKWTIPALEELMGGSITLMAAGYTPAPVEADNEPTPRSRKTNRPP